MEQAGLSDVVTDVERKQELIAQRNALQQEIEQMQQSPVSMNGFNPATFLAYDRLRGQIMEKFSQWRIAANSDADKYLDKTRAEILQDNVEATIHAF